MQKSWNGLISSRKRPMCYCIKVRKYSSEWQIKHIVEIRKGNCAFFSLNLLIDWQVCMSNINTPDMHGNGPLPSLVNRIHWSTGEWVTSFGRWCFLGLWMHTWNKVMPPLSTQTPLAGFYMVTSLCCTWHFPLTWEYSRYPDSGRAKGEVAREAMDAPFLEVLKARVGMGPWAAISSEWQPCPRQGTGTRWSLRSLLIQAILWFSNSMKQLHCQKHCQVYVHKTFSIMYQNEIAFRLK